MRTSTFFKSHILLGLCLILSSCEDEGDNTATGNPTSSKPTIEIISPTLNTTPNDSNQILLHVKFQDKVELFSTSIALTARAISGGAYFTETRALNGTEAEFKKLVDLRDINLLGSHLLTVNASNDLEKQELTSFDFQLVDNVDPKLTVIEFYSDLPGGAGTPHSKFNITASDNYALKKITFEIYRTDASGNEINNLFLKEETISTFKKTYSYDQEFQISGAASSGDYYIGKIMVVDEADNIKSYTSAVEQYF